MTFLPKLPFKLALLPKIIIAIILGIVCSTFFPMFLNRFFVTISGIFGNFLSFSIPLIILGLVAPGIAELGKGAGKLLGITALIAYASTLISGFFSYFTCRWSYPMVLAKNDSFSNVEELAANTINPFMSIDMPPVMSVTTALILAFVVLYNLTNINILERNRELATLKVLGFLDNEVHSYVLRENIILTAFGTVFSISYR